MSNPSVCLASLNTRRRSWHARTQTVPIWIWVIISTEAFHRRTFWWHVRYPLTLKGNFRQLTCSGNWRNVFVATFPMTLIRQRHVSLFKQWKMLISSTDLPSIWKDDILIKVYEFTAWRCLLGLIKLPPFIFIIVWTQCTVKSLHRISKTINYDNEHRTAQYVTSKFLSSVDRLFGAVCGALYWLWRPTCSNSNLLEAWTWKKSWVISILHANNTCRYFVDIWGYFFKC